MGFADTDNSNNYTKKVVLAMEWTARLSLLVA